MSLVVSVRLGCIPRLPRAPGNEFPRVVIVYGEVGAVSVDRRGRRFSNPYLVELDPMERVLVLPHFVIVIPPPIMHIMILMGRILPPPRPPP